jgi:hypothetical protein
MDLQAGRTITEFLWGVQMTVKSFYLIDYRTRIIARDEFSLLFPLF